MAVVLIQIKVDCASAGARRHFFLFLTTEIIFSEHFSAGTSGCGIYKREGKRKILENLIKHNFPFLYTHITIFIVLPIGTLHFTNIILNKI